MQPQNYYKNNSLQKKDAKYVLDNYLDLVQFAEKTEKVLDLGCGTGDVTCEILLPRLPKSVHQVIGGDSSWDMIEFAKSKWGSYSVKFCKLDIAAVDVPADFEENFDHIFSFYCLHWIHQQRRALKNMHSLLKPNGSMLVAFLASNPIFTVYENMARKSAWREYMTNYENYISPYHHSENPESDLENLLKETGFNVKLCKALDLSYTFPNYGIWKQAVIAVNPFIPKIPENQVDMFISDFFTEVKNHDQVRITVKENNNEEEIFFTYKLFVVCAAK